jgi:flagellar protein FlbD
VHDCAGNNVIPLSRLRHTKKFLLNCDLIQRIEPHVDTTVVHMNDGTEYVVADSAEQIVERIIHYRAQIIAVAGVLQSRNGFSAEATYAHDGDRGDGHDGERTTAAPVAELGHPAGADTDQASPDAGSSTQSEHSPLTEEQQ